jgi:prephenate dehydrogenase
MAKSRVTIVGLGLIGSSIGLALKKNKLDIEIIGHDKDLGIAGTAQKRGAVDGTKWNLIDACDGASLIILALPLDGIKLTLDALQSNMASGVIITDTATTKVPVMEWAKNLPQGVHFIGGNPILKSERIQGEGVAAADADLFQGATYCLMPSVASASQAIDTMSNFVATLGAKPHFIDAHEHDGLMAGVEHLPALLATALASATMTSQGWRELARVAGKNYRTATESIPTDSASAREQFISHRQDLIRWIDVIMQELATLRGVLEWQDAVALESTAKKIIDIRAKWQSGAYDQAESAVNMNQAGMNIGHILFGNLADRGRKK